MCSIRATSCIVVLTALSFILGACASNEVNSYTEPSIENSESELTAPSDTAGVIVTTTKPSATDAAAAPDTTVPEVTPEVTVPASPDTTVPEVTVQAMMLRCSVSEVTSVSDLTSGTALSDPTVSLPGESYEFGPPPGEALAIVGVSWDDMLNIRDVPGGELIARIENLGGGEGGGSDLLYYVYAASSEEVIAMVYPIVATGRTRRLPTTIWHEVSVGDIVGWASGAYLAPLGVWCQDETARVVEALGGVPVADTLEELGVEVSKVFTSNGETRSRVTISTGPGIFEGQGGIVLDVIGLPDDSTRGYRIEVGASPGVEDWMQVPVADAGPFTLQYVITTPICYNFRGTSEEGFCN